MSLAVASISVLRVGIPQEPADLTKRLDVFHRATGVKNHQSNDSNREAVDRVPGNRVAGDAQGHGHAVNFRTSAVRNRNVVSDARRSLLLALGDGVLSALAIGQRSASRQAEINSAITSSRSLEVIGTRIVRSWRSESRMSGTCSEAAILLRPAKGDGSSVSVDRIWFQKAGWQRAFTPNQFAAQMGARRSRNCSFSSGSKEHVFQRRCP